MSGAHAMPVGCARVRLAVRTCAGASSRRQNIDARVLPAGDTREGVNLHVSGTVVLQRLFWMEC